MYTWFIGQARKSLWIETRMALSTRSRSFGQARKSLWIETARLWAYNKQIGLGQARKSLWIETLGGMSREISIKGQARKSLWIETRTMRSGVSSISVRLVRACGSKLFFVMTIDRQP